MPANNDLREVRVAVTGGTSGLGLALVRRLVACGARVALVARNARAVEQIADQTGAHGIVGDVGRKEDIHPIALQVLGNLGGLDALITSLSEGDRVYPKRSHRKAGHGCPRNRPLQGHLPATCLTALLWELHRAHHALA